MSPIGRTFLVLNLALSGLFVAFSGTYLKRADHYRQLNEDLSKEMKAETDRLRGDLTSTKEELDNQRRIAGSLETAKKALDAQIAEKNRDYVALQGRISTMEGTMKLTTSSVGTIASEVKTARTESASALAKAIAAEAAKDEAVAAKEVADAALSKAQFEIKNKDKEIRELGATVAMHAQKIRENKVMMALVTQKVPGIFETILPKVDGAVSQVSASGNLVTIAIKSGAENLKSGHRFAIFSAADGYKGEATVTDIDGSKKFCFARLTLKQGKKIDTGDSASTNLDRSSN